MFWRLTPREVLAAIEAINRRQSTLENAANLRAGVVAATICNVNPYRKRGARPVQPGDFFRSRPVAMSVEETEAALDLWMIRQNRKHQRT